MSKNLTRKGLALGTALAFSASAFTGVSAFAAQADTSYVSLTPSTGTEYTVLYQGILDLKSNFSSSILGTNKELKFFVTDATSSLQVDAGFSTGALAADPAANGGSIATLELASSIDGTATDGTTKRLENGSFVIDTNEDDNAADALVRLQSTSTADDYSVTITAWIDNNGDNGIDDTEYASPTRTVRFIKATSLAVTTSITTPLVGSNEIVATIKTVPNLNGAAVASNVTASFTRQGSDSTVDGANATWDDTKKEFTAKVSTKLTADNTPWNLQVLPTAVNTTNLAIADSDTTNAGTLTVTVNTAAAHGLVTGDWVIVNAQNNDADQSAPVQVTKVDADTFTYAFTAPGNGDETAAAGADTGTWKKATNATIAGTYTAKAKISSTAVGNTATTDSAAVKSDDSTLTIEGTNNIQPGTFTAESGSNDVKVRKGTLSVPVSFSVIDIDDKAVTAGRPVVIALSGSTGTFKVNGLTAPQTVYTDAAGKVSFTVSEDDGDASATTTVTATPEGVTAAAASVDLIWDDAEFKLYDLATSSADRVATRSVNKSGSLTFSLALLDQWRVAAADGTHRLLVTNSGNTVSSNYVTLSAGKASVTVADAQIAAGSSITTSIAVEKLVSSTWTYQPTLSWKAVDNNDGALGNITINVVSQTDAINLDATNATVYGNVTSALTSTLAAKSVVAIDTRTSQTAVPAYANAAIVGGNVVNSVTGAVRPGAVVTISGDSSFLFNNGAVYSKGSITLVADASGEFGVNIYSNKSATDSVITVTSNGASKTVKVTFSAVAARGGKTLTITAPTTAKAGRTLTITGILTDANGNPVDTDQDATKAAGDSTLDATDARFVVTYDGPGLIVGSLPAETDANGKFTVRVLLGAYDSGLATLTATYGSANGTIATADTGDDIDVSVSKSVLVAVSAKITKAATSKVTVKNASGLTVKVVRGSKSVTKTATSDSYKVSLKGGSGTVKVYVNGVKVASK